jgi:CRP-like cAMP-binding protein
MAGKRGRAGCTYAGGTREPYATYRTYRYRQSEHSHRTILDEAAVFRGIFCVYYPARFMWRKERVAMSSPHDPKQNHILAALRAEDYARLLPDLELTSMPLGWSVYEANVPMGHVYFPTTCLVSLLYVMENGDSAEIAVIGNDGMVGASVYMGGGSMSSRAVVQNAGECYRLKAELLKKEFALGGSLQLLTLRFTQALMAQMVQTGACNRHHTVDQQLCRWLLLTLDRLPGNEVTMTQKLIANMLGVRREGVTEATDMLQRDGSIRYSGGRITVLDRLKLEKRACECYSVVRKEIERLFAFEIQASVPALTLV